MAHTKSRRESVSHASLENPGRLPNSVAGAHQSYAGGSRLQRPLPIKANVSFSPSVLKFHSERERRSKAVSIESRACGSRLRSIH